MANVELIKLVQCVQAGDKQAMEELLNRFSPLICKYANYLDGEDSAQEISFLLLRIALKLNIENLKSRCDPVLIKYFQQSIYRGYIALSKKRNLYENKVIALLDLPPYILPRVEKNMSTNDCYFENENLPLKEYLTDLEYEIISRIVLHDEQASNVAADLRISRQAVSKTKVRALKKLREAKFLQK